MNAKTLTQNLFDIAALGAGRPDLVGKYPKPRHIAEEFELAVDEAAADIENTPIPLCLECKATLDADEVEYCADCLRFFDDLEHGVTGTYSTQTGFRE